MQRVLISIGIPQIGVGGSKQIAKHFNNDIEKFIIADIKGYDFTQIEDVGEITNNAIHTWLKDQNNQDILVHLLEEITIKEDVKVTSSEGVFNGLKIYCTGSFASHKKEELKQIVENNGGEFAAGYAKSLDYLVVGSLKGSSKEDKAKKDGVKILTENEFLEMIK